MCDFVSNISKTSASVSSGVPNTEKVMKAQGRRPSAFIVLRCLEPLMKHKARVFDMASQRNNRKLCSDMFSQTKQYEIMQCYIFRPITREEGAARCRSQKWFTKKRIKSRKSYSLSSRYKTNTRKLF